jgi:hypothetical protein
LSELSSLALPEAAFLAKRIKYASSSQPGTGTNLGQKPDAVESVSQLQKRLRPGLFE